MSKSLVEFAGRDRNCYRDVVIYFYDSDRSKIIDVHLVSVTTCPHNSNRFENGLCTTIPAQFAPLI